MALCLGYKFRAVDAAGAPLAAGLVYTYSPGTTNDKATYSDRALTTPNANPVVLDAAGEADIYLDGLTKLLIKTSAGVTIDTVDNVMGAVSNYDSPTFNDLTIGDDLTVADDVTVGGDIAVTGDISVGDDLSVTDDVTVGGNINCQGAINTYYYLYFLAGLDAAGITAAPGLSIYVSAADGKLYFKNGAGNSNALY